MLPSEVTVTIRNMQGRPWTATVTVEPVDHARRVWGSPEPRCWVEPHATSVWVRGREVDWRRLPHEIQTQLEKAVTDAWAFSRPGWRPVRFDDMGGAS